MAESERSFGKNTASGERSSSLDVNECKNRTGERSSSTGSGKQLTESVNKKGKQPAKSSSKGKSKSTESQSQAVMDSENKILSAISSLQASIKKQTEKMNEHEKQIYVQNRQLKDFSSKLASYEENDELNDCCNYDDNQRYSAYDEEHDDESCPLDDDRFEICATASTSTAMKRKSESDENNNRFQAMSKRFKASEPVDTEIDQILAENITELFRQGIDDDRYSELVKDENTPRPKNCDGLVVVQTNPLIWECVSASARTVDKKMQNIEISVVKSATKLAKMVNNMAKIEDEVKNDEFSKIIDECNDVLAILGHSNKQINLARKDFLRPELNKEYSHLCNHNRPFTKFLFGDDVSKSAKEKEDCSKISHRIVQSRPFRGYPRRRIGRMSRFRGGFGRGTRGKAQGPSWGDPSTSTVSKNFPRRGFRPYRQ